VGDETDNIAARLRLLPSVNSVLETELGQRLLAVYSRPAVLETVRASLDVARASLRDGGQELPVTREFLLREAQSQLEARDRGCLQRVLNATGIVLHTNLGRAPMADAAVEAVRRIAGGYSNLEMDLTTGKRGGRGGQGIPLLCRLTGAEAALVVNNNAAAVLLALSSLASSGEIIVSRGELVEIGGAFRVPDVIRQSGARLVEVGTTNKTRLSDYAQAITPDTKVLLKVHASNYRIIGFTEEASLADLSKLGREQNLIVLEDLGSGALVDLTQYGLPPEPTVMGAIKAGADVVAFSGDKLLGGPQCGLLVGRRASIAQMSSHPLYRALRADKMTLAALEATLSLYEDPERLPETLPVLRMLSQSPEILRQRARRLRTSLSKLSGLTATITDGVSYSGGGTLPEERLPSRHVQVRSSQLSPEHLAERLRRRSPALIGMIADGAFVLDVRTLRDSEIAEVVQAFRSVLKV
jgi:L-seryl-tRNA(Ser) seleniumtransferase